MKKGGRATASRVSVEGWGKRQHILSGEVTQRCVKTSSLKKKKVRWEREAEGGKVSGGGEGKGRTLWEDVDLSKF